MREDQMSKLDRGLVTFSADGARKSRGGKPTQILTGPLYQIMPFTLLLPPRIFKASYGLVTSASWDTECPRGIFNTQADMSFKMFTIFYVF